MSLNLSVEGMAYNATKVAGTALGLAALADTDFDSGSAFGDSSKLILFLDNSGVPAPNAEVSLPAPSALGAVGGVELTLINDTNGKKITFTDPNTGYTMDYANRASESITLVADDENDQWIFKF